VNGDLFDFWFEYGHAIPKRFVRVLQAGELRAGGSRYVCRRKSDFWIGNYLERELDVSFTDAALTLELQAEDLLATGRPGPATTVKAPETDPPKRVAAASFAGSIRCRDPSRRDIALEPQPRAARRADGSGFGGALAGRAAAGYDAVVLGHFHRPLHHRERREFLILGDWLSGGATPARGRAVSLLEFGTAEKPA